MTDTTFRRRTAAVHRRIDETGLAARLVLSVGFAGFLAFMGTLSFPVPWTPVPFSMMPLALLVTGAYQRPGYAALSVVLYLLAGGLGAPIYADGESGWRHLIGNTAGYLFGFVVMAAFVSWYMQRRRTLMPTGWATVVLAGLGLLVVAAVAAIIRFAGTGTGFAEYGDDYEAWSVTPSVLWVLAFVTVALGAA